MGSAVASRIPAEIVVTDWDRLRTQDPVVVQFKTGEQQPGIVDQVFTEGNILWIWPAGPEVRQLILKADISHIRCRTAGLTTARLAVLLR